MSPSVRKYLFKDTGWQASLRAVKGCGHERAPCREVPRQRLVQSEHALTAELSGGYYELLGVSL